MIPLNRVLFIVNHCTVTTTWGHAQSRVRGHLYLQLSLTCSVLSGGPECSPQGLAIYMRP